MDRLQYIIKNIKGKVLDIGCSQGKLHEKIVERYPSVIGLDLRYPDVIFGVFVIATCGKIPFKNQCMDTLIAGEIIEHLVDPNKLLPECYRVLKDGGIFIITTPNKMSYINRIFKSYNTRDHVSLMAEHRLRELLTQNRFQIKEFLYLPMMYEGLWKPTLRYRFQYFYWLRRIIHYFMPKKLREDMVVLARKE